MLDDAWMGMGVETGGLLMLRRRLGDGSCGKPCQRTRLWCDAGRDWDRSAPVRRTSFAGCQKDECEAMCYSAQNPRVEELLRSNWPWPQTLAKALLKTLESEHTLREPSDLMMFEPDVFVVLSA